MIVAGLRVDQDDGIAFLAQGFARLGAAVIELARLADDDGTGADEQDFFQIGATRHEVSALQQRLPIVYGVS